MVLFVFIFCNTFCSTTDSKIPYERRLTIAIGDFQNRSNESFYDELTYNPSGNFTYELNRYDLFRIIERERLGSLLDEYKFTMTGLVVQPREKTIGKILGVDAILYVTLTSVIHKVDEKNLDAKVFLKNTAATRGGKLYFLSGIEELTVTVDGRLVSLTTGEVLASAKYKSRVENNYAAITGIGRSGSSMDRMNAIKKILDDSSYFIARDIADQVDKNLYKYSN
jgi:curli biogenesis system outer membrane secretion channel CsgG